MSPVASYRPALARILTGCVLVAGLAAPASAVAVVVPSSANMETGDLTQFVQASSLNASLTVSTQHAYDGTYSAQASSPGNGLNSYARGQFEPTWNSGDDVWYGAAYYLPVGFKTAMQQEVSLMRWDNYPTYSSTADYGGIVLWGSDKRARLNLGTYSASSEQIIVGPFDLPEGRWFWLEVHQRLGTTNALSEVYLDGTLVGSSTAPNSAGRTIDRMRYGLVAQGSTSQTNPLTLFFDRATIGTSQLGPLE